MSVYEATNASIEHAVSSKALDRSLSAGPIAALLVLARKIDTEDELRDIVLEHAGDDNVKMPPADNVSIPTYLKYCEALRLTPSSVVAVVQSKGRAVDELRNRRARKAQA